MVDDGESLDHAITAARRELELRPHDHPTPKDVLLHAIGSRRSLFRPNQHAELHQRRARALQAMRALIAFTPRLTGDILAGACSRAPVRLLLTADSTEDVALSLIDQGIPWRSEDYRLTFAGTGIQTCPGFSFLAGGIRIELVVLGPEARSRPPLDGYSGRPLEQMDPIALEALIRATG